MADKRNELHVGKNSWKGLVLNLIIALFLYMDMSVENNLCMKMVQRHSLLWYVELIVIVGLLLNACLYSWKLYHWIHHVVTQDRKDGLAAPTPKPGSPKCETISWNMTPVNCSATSWISDSPDQSGMQSSMNISLNSSWSFNANSSVSQLGTPHTPTKATANGDSLRKRVMNSPTSEFINDKQQLEEYLNDFENKEKAKMSVTEKQTQPNISFWNIRSPNVDLTPILTQFSYQLAPRNTESGPTGLGGDPTSSPGGSTGDEVWRKYDISKTTLNSWSERLRQWLSGTVLKRLVQQIDSINTALVGQGCPDMAIGVASLSQLRTAALTRSQLVPALPSILPFFELHSNQAYLVQRIRDLAKGGCVSEFRWNSGGSHAGQPWSDSLPSDAQIVIHLLGAYLDMRLPADPSFPDGKTFTRRHVVIVPDKPVKKDALVMFQSQLHPPHYNIVIGEETINMPKGYKNVWYALLYFFYHVKTKEGGMLGRVNLGLSGINLLWVFE